MPLYEYECAACHRRTEKIQKFSDPELTTCPHCGGKLARTLTAPAVQFKGSGWYKDLYSSAKPAGSGAADKGATTEGAKGAPETGGTASPAAPASAAPSAPAASTGTSGSTC